MADDPTVPRHKGGRPRLVDDPTSVSTWVKRQEYDRIYQLAKDREQSLSSVVRDLITRGLRRS